MAIAIVNSIDSIFDEADERQKKHPERFARPEGNLPLKMAS
jgi:hypothetical protein